MAKRQKSTTKKTQTKQEETLGGAAKSLLEAVAFLVILVLLVGCAVLVTSFVSNNKEAAEISVTEEKPEAKLPWDIPLYVGSSLTRYTHSGKKSIFEYDLPQGSIGSVQKFYQDKFEGTDWVRQPRSSQYSSEYMGTTRTLFITLSYRTGKVHMKMQIVENK